MNQKHGHSRQGKTSPEYWIWASIRRRCLNPKDNSYEYYGGRGVKICERWMLFENFISDMGVRPSPELILGRKNNDGDYEHSNCRWVTRLVQGSNRRNNVFLTFNGRTQIRDQWAREVGLSKSTLQHRLDSGWSVASAISQPAIRR